MSMFRAFQLQLQNMAMASEKFLRLSKASYNTTLALIDVMSEKRHEHYGLGEDIVTKSAEVVTLADRLSVPLLSPTPGVVTFKTKQYSYAVLHTAVVLQGVGLSWQIKKTYATQPPQAPVLFGPSQLPLLSDNNQLIVTIQPGGEFFAAALLQELTML